jgi:pyruvate,orthophosphate dikinase
LKVKSKALEVNLADYHVDVTIDGRYIPLQQVMSKYFGLLEGVNTFLKELSHPYKNWRFIVNEARRYALEHFHVVKQHPQGPVAARLLIEIFLEAMVVSTEKNVPADAADNILIFVQKITKESGSAFTEFKPLLDEAFELICNLEPDRFVHFVQSFYQINRLAGVYLKQVPETGDGFGSLNRLLAKYLEHTYTYWLREDDPHRWFRREAAEFDSLNRLDGFFQNISHRQLTSWQDRLHQIVQGERTPSKEVLRRLLELPGFNQIVDHYRRIPRDLLQAGAENGRGYHLKLIFLFHIMNIAGLSQIHEETLREINQTLTWIIVHDHYRNIQYLIRKTFSILKESAGRYPATALNCVLNMGKGVFKTDDLDLVNFFIDSVIDLGFQAPNLQGVDDDWQIRVNSAHIQNIRTWMELIELKPKWATRLLSGLIIHLSLCGVFIKDIELFPRDVTRFLNSGIAPVLNLTKQLMRLFPVYFNDIGAEGRLRDVSTRIDEICQRRDLLVHFLRKQSHVESSSRIVAFMEAVFQFWKTRDKECLRPYVPPTIFDQIEPSGLFVDGMHRILYGFEEQGISVPGGMLCLSEDDGYRLVQNTAGVSDQDRERMASAVTFYKLLKQKYDFDFVEFDTYLNQLRTEALPDLDRLQQSLREPEFKKRLFMLLDYLEKLQAVILSDTSYEIREDIYKKRHITIDIPSMYGSYHEMKFDCLSLTYRIESVVNVLFEQLVDNYDFTLITKAIFYEIYGWLRLFEKALHLDGIVSLEFERQLDFLAHSLEVKGFTLTQYLDIFKGFAQAVKNIINDHFNNIHGQNLTRILSQITIQTMLPKFLPEGDSEDTEKNLHRASEIFFRDRIASSLGLQQLDLFITRILNTLFQQSQKLPKDKLHLLLLYDPQIAMTSLDSSGSRLSGIIHLGNKGQNLVRLKSFGYPVPPGFIITTEVFRCRSMIFSYPPAEENFKEQIARHIAMLENTAGSKFGSTGNPLLLSVRSGSAISQPGMMDTLLNVGINEDIVHGIAEQTGNPWFAWDNYRRFLQTYGMSFGLERDAFDAIISESKQRVGIPFKRYFTGEQMKQVAMGYKQLLLDSGIDIVYDPFEQFYQAIKRVLVSWESPKAKTYRKIMGISDDWGTAVTAQAMVYGNRSRQSGTGVFFTHNPRWAGDTIRLWGDFSIGNQGEDVVAGLVKTMPISVFQQEVEMRETDVTLETHFPEIYQAMKDWTHDLIEEKGWSPQEIEFTFESAARKDLYLLQTRDMTIRERKKVLTFDFDPESQVAYLGHGIGVSGGALSGRLVFTLDEIKFWRSRETGTQLILARSDTVPDDIREIHAADGLLTARGGLTSHAAVVAHRLDKTCVVGCANLDCSEKDRTCVFNQVIVKSGDFISIDGQEGSVFQGQHKIKEA